MKTFTVNLDLEPELRWNEVTAFYKDEMQELIPAFNQSLAREFGWFGYLLKYLLAYINIPLTYQRELSAISAQSGIPYSVLVGLNVGLDFMCACTSAAVITKEGLFHLRNMDWDIDVLRKLTCQIDFIRQGQHLYSSVLWAGFVGCLTSCSTHNFSISLNYRKDRNFNFSQILRLLFGYQKPISFELRDIMEISDSWETAISKVNKLKVCPCYLLVSGVNDAILFIKNYQTTTKRYLNNNYLIQTNHDLDIDAKVPDYEKWCDGDELLLNSKTRYSVANSLLSSAKYYNNLSNILYTPPILNNQTIYSVIMSPSQGKFIHQHVHQL